MKISAAGRCRRRHFGFESNNILDVILIVDCTVDFAHDDFHVQAES